MIYRNVEFPFQVSWGEVQRNIFLWIVRSFPLAFADRAFVTRGVELFFSPTRSFWINLANSDQSILAKKQYKKKNMQKEIPLQMENSEVIDLKKKVLNKQNTHPSTKCFDVLVGMLLTLVVEQGIQPVVFLVCFMRARVRHDVECIKKVGDKDASGIENWVIPQIHEFPAVSSGIFVREMFMKCSIKHIRFLGAILFKHTFHSNPRDAQTENPERDPMVGWLQEAKNHIPFS